MKTTHNNGNNKAPQQKKRRALLSASSKEQMVAVILRNPEVFAKTREQIKPRDLHAMDVAHSWSWRATCAFWDDHAELPTKAQLVTEVNQLIQSGAGSVNDVEVEKIGEFIALLYDKKTWGKNLRTDAGYAAWTLKMFARWKSELIAYRVQAQLVHANTTPIDLVESLQGCLREAEEATVLNAKPSRKLFFDGWDKVKKIIPTSTGLKVLDMFLGDGWCKGEIVLFVGPFGSCKSVLAVMGAIESAKRCMTLTASPKNKDGKVYKAVIVSYEMDDKEMRDRCLCYGAKIPRFRLKKLASYDMLRDGGEPEKYEKKRYASVLEAGGVIPTEKQRMEEIKHLLNEHCLFIDMTSSDPNSPTGSGGAQELFASLEIEKKQNSKLVFELVVIDHLAAMVDRMVGDKIKREDKTDMLARLPLQLKGWVATKHNCPVLLMHQLSGEANNRSVTATFHYTDTADCKSVAKYADFAIATGPTTQDGRQLCVWDCSKHRREPPRSRQVVKLNGAYNELIGTGNKYVVDTATRRIVSAEEYASIHGGKTPGEVNAQPKGPNKKEVKL